MPRHAEAFVRRVFFFCLLCVCVVYSVAVDFCFFEGGMGGERGDSSFCVLLCSLLVFFFFTGGGRGGNDSSGSSFVQVPTKSLASYEGCLKTGGPQQGYIRLGTSVLGNYPSGSILVRHPQHDLRQMAVPQPKVEKGSFNMPPLEGTQFNCHCSSPILSRDPALEFSHKSWRTCRGLAPRNHG